MKTNSVKRSFYINISLLVVIVNAVVLISVFSAVYFNIRSLYYDNFQKQTVAVSNYVAAQINGDKIEDYSKNFNKDSYYYELNTMLYAVPSQALGITIEDSKQKKSLQATFFKNVYSLLIGKEKGPRLYLFLYALDQSIYMPLLDFSFPMTDDEREKSAAEDEDLVVDSIVTSDIEEKGKYSTAINDMTIQPIKPVVGIDIFKQLDLRVCEIIKCQEIRKSDNCLKLTLNDGLNERVIVSSISHNYSSNELIGKKIIIVANLESARITGVTSEGMLLAVTSDSGKCTVIFVDDNIPNGAMLS